MRGALEAAAAAANRALTQRSVRHTTPLLAPSVKAAATLKAAFEGLRDSRERVARSPRPSSAVSGDSVGGGEQAELGARTRGVGGGAGAAARADGAGDEALPRSEAQVGRGDGGARHVSDRRRARGATSARSLAERDELAATRGAGREAAEAKAREEMGEELDAAIDNAEARATQVAGSRPTCARRCSPQRRSRAVARHLERIRAAARTRGIRSGARRGSAVRARRR